MLRAGVSTMLVRLGASAHGAPCSGVDEMALCCCSEASSLGLCLDEARNRCRCIFVESSGSISDDVRTRVLCAVDSVLITVDASEPLFAETGRLLAAIAEVRRASNPELAFRGALITSYDERLSENRRNASSVRSIFGGSVFSTRIRGVYDE
ncbi:ParA family protein [Chlorobium sp. N1]|uniref:ParA family protein n=1 Tax=Chlorobium sp. N1 TaxID=2491138 RepID=UPI00103A8B4F|nr:ParA family protein [Chlorobium sp. N1]TCD47183.1 ParA family protein [Chlorobium sp. N1]